MDCFAALAMTRRTPKFIAFQLLAALALDVLIR
jgi:hypothetical protein